MRTKIAPLFALGVFAFVAFGGEVVTALGPTIADGDPGPVSWQWLTLLGLLAANLVLLVGGSVLWTLRQRRR